MHEKYQYKSTTVTQYYLDKSNALFLELVKLFIMHNLLLGVQK